MTISILIAVYNNRNYLRKTILSILTQSYEISEIIICDDGSDDNSLETISDLTEVNNIKILINEKNEGVGFTKKRLVDNSTGDFFAFLDSDDILPKDAVKQMMDEIEDGVGLYYSMYKLIDDNDRIIKQKNQSKPLKRSLFDESFNYPIFHFAVYSRKYYNLTSGLNVSYKSAEDLDLWLKIEEIAGIKFVHKELYFYRENVYGVSQSRTDALKWIYNILYHFLALADAANRRNLDFDRLVKNASLILVNGILKRFKFKQILKYLIMRRYL